MAARLADHQSTGSCYAQPGRGVVNSSGDVADVATSPVWRTRIARTPLVPMSTPSNKPSATSTHSEQDLHRELVEALVGVTGLPHRGDVERLGLERCRPLWREPECPGASFTTRPNLREQLLDLGVAVPLLCFGFENQICPHAAGGEIPDAVGVFGAVRVRIEVT